MIKFSFALFGIALLAASPLQAQNRGRDGARNRSELAASRPVPAVRSQVLAGRSIRSSYARNRPGSYGDFRSHHRGGRYYYLSGSPYFYPYYDIGFGYPSYYYGNSFGFGYAGPLYGGAYPYGAYFDPEDQPYEGRVVEETAPSNLKRRTELNGANSLPAAVQRQLAKYGYYKSSIDGQFGPASKEALRRFQRAKGLKQTGLIDDATLRALNFSTQ